MADIFHDIFVIVITILAGFFAIYSTIIETERRKYRNKLKTNIVDKHTRAGSMGKMIQCPHCLSETKVYHFSWVSIVCDNCNAVVKKQHWRLD